MLVSKRVRRVWDKLRDDFSAFDATTSDVMHMRNILEHIDEYICNSGRNRSIVNTNLYSTIFDEDGRLDWAGLKFDRHMLHGSAANITREYREITSHEFRLYREASDSATHLP